MQHEEIRAQYEKIASQLWSMSVTVSEEDFVSEQRTFSDEEIQQAWATLLESEQFNRSGRLVSLYVHSPLCLTKCAYCQCGSRPIVHKEERQLVVSAILAEVDRFAELFKDTPVKDVYFGGGTPSLYSPSQLDRLLSGVLGRFTVAGGAERTIEMNPASSSRAKLRIARDHGFNRVSFGIQTLSGKVLDAYNRGYQRSQNVASAIGGARELGFSSVNGDLLFLPGETVDGWARSVSEVVAARPTTLHFYRLQPVPGLRLSAASYQQHEAALPAAYDVFRSICVKAGYSCPARYRSSQMAYVATEGSSSLLEPTYRQNPRDGASLLGLGPGSRSVCRGSNRYQNRAALVTGYQPDYFGSGRTWGEEQRGYLITQLAHHCPLERMRFARRFGFDAVTHFREEFELLQRLGFASLQEHKIEWKADSPQELMVAALVLAGQDSVAAIQRSLEDIVVPSWLPQGVVGETGWAVTGQDKSNPSWTRLESPNQPLVLFQLRPQSDEDEPRCCRDGWMFTYNQQPLPPGAGKALLTLYKKVTGGGAPKTGGAD